MTVQGEIDATEDGDRDNPVEAAIARIQAAEGEPGAAPARRGRGRPRGSKTRRRSSSSPRAPRPASQQPAPLVQDAGPSETELKMLGKLLGTGWRMVARRTNHRELEPAELLELADAAHPVLVKYGAQWGGQYAAEIGLALTVWGLWEVTALEPAKPTPDSSGDHASADLAPSIATSATL